MTAKQERHTPNKALQHWFDLSGYSKHGLAQEITRRAYAAGHKHVSPDGSRVRRWLNEGERPRDPVPAILAQIFSERTATPLTPADLGIGANRTPEPRDRISWGGQPTIEAIRRTARVSLLSEISYDPKVASYEIPPEQLLARLQPWVHAHPTPLPDAVPEAGGSLGMADVHRVRAATHVFRQLDNTYGGGLARQAVIGQLAWTNDLLTKGTYSERVGRALFAALADLCGVAGWMSHDSGLIPDAIRYLVLGVQAAKESGDRALGAHLLQCLARVHGYINQPAAALEFVTLALYGSRDAATPRVRAGLHALEARFSAMLRREQDTLGALRRAQESFGDAGDIADDPEFAAYLDQAELTSMLAEVHVFLAHALDESHRAAPAVELLELTTSARRSERVRSRAFDAITLSRAHLATGEPEAAATAATTAMDLAEVLASARVITRLHDLIRESGPFTSAPAIAAMRERIATARSRAPLIGC